MFDMTDNLCKRYPSLSPFTVRRERAGEVFLLVNRLNDKVAREDDGAQATGAPISRGNIRRDAKGNIHIRRRASDDNIF